MYTVLVVPFVMVMVTKTLFVSIANGMTILEEIVWNRTEAIINSLSKTLPTKFEKPNPTLTRNRVSVRV